MSDSVNTGSGSDGRKSSMNDDISSEASLIENEDGIGTSPSNERKCCKKKERPWEIRAAEMPDFGYDPTGRREFAWKMGTVKKLRPARVVVSVIWGQVMAMLDMSIVSVALVTFTDYFHKSSSQVQWVSDGYSIFLAAFAIIAGKVGDRMGAVNVNHVSMLCFMIFSVTCCFARSDMFWLLILSRLLQGISASFLMSTTMSLASSLVNPYEVSKAMSWIGASISIANALGPFVGGLIIQFLSWEFIFLINVPIGLCGMIVTSILLPATPRLKEKKFDYLGGILTVLFLAILVFGITQISSYAWLGGICILATIILIVVFCIWERRFICPLMPADVLFNYRVISGLSACMFSFATMALLTYQTPFLMQFAWGYSPFLSGVYTLPYTIASGIAGVVFGQLNQKYASLALKTLSNCMSIVGTLITSFSGFGGLAVMLVGSIIMGAGASSYVTSSNTYIMVITPLNSKGAIGGCIQCFRETGFALGIAVSCMFQDIFYDMMWGDDVPSGKIMPEDFAETYKYTYLYVGLSFLIIEAIGFTLTQVSGAHGYEYERNFKGIPKRIKKILAVQVEECHARGVTSLGFPYVPPGGNKDDNNNNNINENNGKKDQVPVASIQRMNEFSSSAL